MLLERKRVGDERGRQESRMHRLHREQDRPDQRAGEGAEEEDGRDGVGTDRVLGAQVVQSEKKRGQQGGQNPVHQKYKAGEPVWLARRPAAANLWAEFSGLRGSCEKSHEGDLVHLATAWKFRCRRSAKVVKASRRKVECQNRF